MPKIATVAAIGATSLVLDTLAGLPAEPQYVVIAGSEELIVESQSGVTLNLATPTAIAHKVNENVAQRVIEQGVRGELVADVKITAEGLVIENGKLIIKDAFGQTSYDAQGFSGNALSFLMSGLYNNQWAFGNNGAMTFGVVATAAQVPYWEFFERSHAQITATRTAAASAPGDSIIAIKVTSTTTGVSARGMLLHEPMLRCQGGRGVVGKVAWRSQGGTLSEPQRVRFQFDFYDKDGAYISSIIRDTEDRTVTGAAGVYLWSITAPAFAPGNANFFRVQVGGFWNIGTSVGTSQVEIAEVTALVSQHEFQQISFALDVIMDRLSANTIRMVSQTDDLFLRQQVPGDVGLNAIGFYIDPDANDRLWIGLQSGDPVIDVDSGSGGAAELRLQGGGLLIDEGADKIRINTGRLELEEQSAAVPLAPTNRAYLYLGVDGTGKSQLKIRYQSGGAHTLDTET